MVFLKNLCNFVAVELIRRLKRLKYHLVAFLTVAIWGSTFVFTKLLLLAGLTPAQIFTLRFIIAYVLLALYCVCRNYFSKDSRTNKTFSKGRLKDRMRRDEEETVLQSCSPCKKEHRWLCHSWRDELLMVLLGVTGGSVYFLAENAAMLYTTATNTSLIVCSCPLFAMLLFAVFYRQSERISRIQAVGSVVACLGMAVVVLNGHFVLHLSPLGDLLAFAACLCWAVYSILMQPALEHYTPLFITRKVFFYGLVTIIPYYLLKPEETWIFIPSILHSQLSIVNCFNLLFLGVVASMLCFLVWNWVIRELGAVVATNWVYFNPITTILFAWAILSEQITVFFLLGTVLILQGMYLADRKK